MRESCENGLSLSPQWPLGHFSDIDGISEILRVMSYGHFGLSGEGILTKLWGPAEDTWAALKLNPPPGDLLPLSIPGVMGDPASEEHVRGEGSPAVQACPSLH